VITIALALALCVAGLGFSFGWCTLRQWRRTGDTGLRLGAGRVGSVTWWAKLLFVGALMLELAGPVTALTGLSPLSALDRPGVRVGGAVLAVIGVLTSIVAQLHLGASWRIGVDPQERTELVTDGIFALARNPIFTAMVVTALGLALLVPNPVALVAAVTLLVSVQLQVRAVEEPYLARTHGPAYAAYAARVGRFVPLLSRF
jgi:protein-S-isoprenylcysteine O-methyltransferase Ste14